MFWILCSFLGFWPCITLKLVLNFFLHSIKWNFGETSRAIRAILRESRAIAAQSPAQSTTFSAQFAKIFREIPGWVIGKSYQYCIARYLFLCVGGNTAVRVIHRFYFCRGAGYTTVQIMHRNLLKWILTHKKKTHKNAIFNICILIYKKGQIRVNIPVGFYSVNVPHGLQSD